MKLVLNNSGVSLGFAVNETGWCTLLLTRNGVRHELGAESIQIVKRCLLSALTDSVVVSPSAVMRNIPVASVLNLHVKPWSIYVGESDERRHLFFRNREEGLIIETLINGLERERWRTLLANFCSNELIGTRDCTESTLAVAAAE